MKQQGLERLFQGYYQPEFASSTHTTMHVYNTGVKSENNRLT